ISHYATCECLSDKKKYPSFLRTIPSDYHQSRALAELVKHFGWTWVGALRTDDDYGNSGMATFSKVAEQLGVCLEYSLPFFRTYSQEKVLRIVEQIKTSTSRVIVAFLAHWDLEILLHVFFEHNITGYQWVGTEGWISDSAVATQDKHNVLQGAIGLAIPKTKVVGLKDFILDINPLKSAGSEIFIKFWEAMFKCKYRTQNDSVDINVCTGNEKLSDIENTFTDMSLLPVFNNVYKGVYAVAHTLHDLLDCKQMCPTKKQPDPLTAQEPDCLLHSTMEQPELQVDGDLIIGGIFSFRTGQDGYIDTFRSMPEVRPCRDLSLREFQNAQTMVFAIEEINNRTDILPGVKLGYKIYDSCGSVEMAIRASLSLVNDHGENTTLLSCSNPETVKAIIAETSSTPTIAISATMGPLLIPVISHFATCACLSDKKKYPSFFRTVPSDYYQSRALAKLVKHFGWTWVGALCSDNDYGNNGMNNFISAAKEEGVCVEFSEAFFRTDPREKIRRIVEIIKTATSKVIVAFISYSDMEVLLKEVALQNITGFQWIGSESWISDMNIATAEWQPILKGSMGFAIPKAQINGLGEFLTKLNSASNVELYKRLWETIFECKLPTQDNIEIKKMCKGNEKLSEVQNPFTDVSELQIANNVYKAVYALAYALHNSYGCSKRDSEKGGATVCTNLGDTQQPWQIVNELKKLHFTTTSGEDVFFDENGDPAARFDLQAFRWTRIMMFAVEEINKDDILLPDITLGYKILDSCASPSNVLRAALTL
ncbi:extracellular calcium-sensing receptor-like, partial [Clarias magur]